jgi:hypothetical protein
MCGEAISSGRGAVCAYPASSSSRIRSRMQRSQPVSVAQRAYFCAVSLLVPHQSRWLHTLRVRDGAPLETALARERARDNRRQREREHAQRNKIREERRKRRGSLRHERDAALIFSVNEERTVARIRFVEKPFGSRRVSKTNGGSK